jgi:hypothetical protein
MAGGTASRDSETTFGPRLRAMPRALLNMIPNHSSFIGEMMNNHEKTEVAESNHSPSPHYDLLYIFHRQCGVGNLAWDIITCMLLRLLYA